MIPRRLLPAVVSVVLSAVAPSLAAAQAASPLAADIDRIAAEMQPQVVAWRRDFHQHPELGNREFRTSKVIAEALRQLGYEVTTGVAHTGVVATLKGARPGPVVALRADMDALPVTEQVDVPFRSTVKTEWNGQQVGVMHACGHDTHMATLRRVAGDDNVRVGPLTGAAEDFSYYQQKVPGLFVFLGVTPRDQDPAKVPQNHSPLFFADESALPVGVRTLAHLAVDFMAGK